MKGPSTPTKMLGQANPSHDSVRAGIRALSKMEDAMSDEDLAVLREKIKAQKERKDDAVLEVRVRGGGTAHVPVPCVCTRSNA